LSPAPVLSIARRAWLLGGLCLFCAAAWAQAAPADRGAITAERQRLQAAFAAEEAQCRQRFAVTACMDDVRKRRRAALAGPRAQELGLDDAERLQRARARREAVARKQKEAAERPVVAPEPQREVRLPPPPVAVTEPRVHESPASEDAARRAAASLERREKIAASQDRIATRQIEHVSRNKKQSAPLPVPAAASAARH